MTDPKTLFEAALQMEIKANRFYADRALRVQHPGTKVLLQELADEEQGHIDRFRAALVGEGLGAGGPLPAPVPDLKIGETLRDDIEITEDSEPGDVLVVAIKAEMTSIRVYGQWAEEHRGTGIEALLRAVIHEEMTHKYRLETLYDDEYLAEN
ncbi:MAG: ferritin family protein [Pseudomonadota bacterium]